MNLQETLNRRNLWDQPVYAQFREEIDPFKEARYFRPLDKAYDGDNTFWSIPSPEPALEDDFWELVKSRLKNEKVKEAARCLAQAVALWEPDGNRLAFAAILRAGVPIADWLCRLLPGSVAVSLSLFVGLGMDRIALTSLQARYPHRKIVFVDGWTGRGGVAREIAQLGTGPLAVLIDPWGWADFSGAREDLFCPTACFTGAATLGFSRTFFVDSQSLFAAYLFPQEYCRQDLVKTWQTQCPAIGRQASGYGLQHKLFHKTAFFKQTDLRLHSNEVCRALINADPDTVYFADDSGYVREHYDLLPALAQRRGVKVVYDCKALEDYQTRVACSFKKPPK